MEIRSYYYTIIFHQTDKTDYGSPIIWVDKGVNPYNCDTHLLLDSDMENTLTFIEYIF